MKVPLECDEWRVRMGGEVNSNRILGNLIVDQCVVADLENSFFADLTMKCAALPWPPDADATVQAAAARTRSKEVVCLTEVERDHYQCSGEDVAAGEFQMLGRILTPRAYPFLLDGEAQSQLLESVPGHEQFFANAPLEDVITVIETALEETPSVGRSSGRDGIAWVTDLDAVPPNLPPAAELARRLGLPHLVGVTPVLVCEYTRVAAPAIKVPRSLDAIDHPPFSTVTDCGASHGLTLPLDGAPDGLPEGVHRGCQLPANAATVRLHD